MALTLKEAEALGWRLVHEAEGELVRLEKLEGATARGLNSTRLEGALELIEKLERHTSPLGDVSSRTDGIHESLDVLKASPAAEASSGEATSADEEPEAQAAPAVESITTDTPGEAVTGLAGTPEEAAAAAAPSSETEPTPEGAVES